MENVMCFVAQRTTDGGFGGAVALSTSCGGHLSQRERQGWSDEGDALYGAEELSGFERFCQRLAEMYRKEREAVDCVAD